MKKKQKAGHKYCKDCGTKLPKNTEAVICLACEKARYDNIVKELQNKHTAY